MIPTRVKETAESWACRSCSSVNVGWRLRCERCGVLVAAPSSVGGPQERLPPPQEPLPPPAPRRGARSAARRVVLSIVGVAIGFGAGVYGIPAVLSLAEGRSAEERVDDYVNGIGEKEFFAADSQFRATFPTVPQRSIEPTEVNGVSLDITFYISDLGAKAFSVSTFDVPPDWSYDLNLGTNGVAAGVDGRVESATPTTWQGFEAVESVLSAPGGATIKMLMIRTPQRVYALQVVSFDVPAD